MPKITTPTAPATGRITDRKDLGRIIRHMRMRAGLTADDAALSIGIAKATLLRAEQGAGGLQFENLLKILNGLGVNLFALPATQDTDGAMAWPNPRA